MDNVPGLSMFANVPGFLPGVVVSVILGFVIRRRVAVRLGLPSVLGWFAIVSVGIILAATLTPLAGSRPSVASSCDFSRVGLASLEEFLKWDDATLNILLFIPLGFVLAFIRPWSLKAALVAGAAVLPVFIETAQMLVRPLDRACQAGDVFDNDSGLVIGLVLGLVAAWLSGASRRPTNSPVPTSDRPNTTPSG
jgi:hypothetical protein